MNSGVAERRGKIARLTLALRRELAACSGIHEAELAGDASFASFGIESLQAVTIAANLSAAFGEEFPVTLFFDYPSIDAWAEAAAGGIFRAPGATKSAGAARAPVAIVGMALRFPGAATEGAFWQNLKNGKDAIVETPAARWDWRDYPDVPAMRWGGFLADAFSFDHELFGIPEPEAARMDPQQKLLLECVHEAIESAQLHPKDLHGTRTGVFVGLSSSDHSLKRGEGGSEASVFDATGNAHSIAANRISYLYNLRGPSLSLDTACSSSLVAFHEACRSLNAGDCDLAIVAGVNVILQPALTKAFAGAGMLSSDGRCKTFDERADGYVRGEGAGVILLKRAGDCPAGEILATARGSAVNHDGKTNGLTAPSGLAQEEVIRAALAAADLSADEIDFVEAHGTGTALGDPVEFLTLARVFGGRKGERTLAVGSAKAFVGHLEAAAGICGLIKTVLCLRHRQLPSQLHFSSINPKMKAALGEIKVASSAILFAEDRPLRAGVSSFGFGGTNAHVILESAPLASGAPKAEVDGPHFLSFSASKEDGLLAAAAAWETMLNGEKPSALDLVARSSAERLNYPERVVLWGEDLEGIRGSLRDWRRGNGARFVKRRLAKAYRPQVAFAFTGQGSQYPGMGEGLGRGFRRRFAEILSHFESYYAEALSEVARGESAAAAALLMRTDYGQALLFALELALARTLEEDHGVTPTLSFGHSLGELSAAAFAGAILTADACRVVAARGLLMQQLTPEGAMLSVRGPREVIDSVVHSTPGLEYAAINGPTLFTLSGPVAVVAHAGERLQEKGLRPKSLAVTRAFHSSLMDPMLAPFSKVLDDVKFHPPRLPLLSGLTGEPVREGEYNKAYWLRQVLEPTQFQGMIEAAAKAGVNTFLEIGPQPVITAMGPECVPNQSLLWLCPLAKGNLDAWPKALAELTALGARRYSKRGGTGPLPFTPFSYRIPGDLPMADANTLLDEFRLLVANLLQVSPAEVDPDTNLVDMGADSLLLLNAIQTIKDRHGVAIGVAEVFRELSTLRAIATYVAERKAPTFASPAAPVSTPVRPAAPAAPARLPEQDSLRIASLNREAVVSPANEDLRAIISHQLALMNQQLALLGGAQNHALVAPAAPVAAAVAPAVPAAPPAVAAPVMGANAAEARGVLGNWRSKADREVSADERARNQYVENLVARFSARTKATKEHTQRYRAFLADNRVSAGFRPNLKEMIYTIVFKSGQGAHFQDLDGNDYIDFTMGFGVNLFGHQPAFIEERVRAQLDQGYCVGPQAELAGIVAEKACRVLNAERIAFLNSGTEAVMTAIRLARAVTRRNRVVIFEGSYHGHADVVLARSGDQGRSLPVAPGVPTGIVGDITVLAYGEASSLEFIRTHGSELAAVLVEPVQSRYPEHQPVEFLRELRALTEASGTALIFDEVICGLRVAPGGAQELFGIKPDLSAYGKILGGGMPIGAVAGKTRFLNPIDGGTWNFGDDSYPQAEMTFFAGTFCKHPVTMAAADAVLDRFLAEGNALTKNLNQRTTALVARLNEELVGLEMQAHNFGSLFRFKSQGNLDLFFANLNLRGAYVWEGRNLFLSTAHTKEDEDAFVRIVREAVAELKPEGFLRKKS